MNQNRIILHVDLNHYYAQVEEMLQPSLRQCAMAVAGEKERRNGIILAKNDLAKSAGVLTGETIGEAKRKCPGLILLSARYDRYLYFSRKIRELYLEYTDQIEPFGIDEAWLDISKLAADCSEGKAIAQKIQTEIYQRYGLTVSIGISFNKVFAKLASDQIKPSGLVVIDKNSYQKTAWSYPVEELLYVGVATKKKMRLFDIYTIGDLAQKEHQFILRHFGKAGEMVWYFARGMDFSPVAHFSYQRPIKSIGNSITAIHDLTERMEIQLVLTVLCESIASRLREQQARGSLITLDLRDPSLKHQSHQRQFDFPSCLSEEILERAMILLDEIWNHEPLRGIGVSVGALSFNGEIEQMNLFLDEKKRAKNETLERTIDQLRERFGFESVKKCSLLIDKRLTNFNPKHEHIIHPVSFQ